jgi:hypothetical protein
MNKPKEDEYSSQVAYTRALEDYCGCLEAKVKHLDEVRQKTRRIRSLIDAQNKVIGDIEGFFLSDDSNSYHYEQRRNSGYHYEQARGKANS